MQTFKKHEEEVCRAVLESLSAVYQILGKPDEDNRNTQEVDFYGKINQNLFYLEHTLIESYPFQITYQKQHEILNQVIDELSGVLPSPGQYSISLSPDALNEFKNKKNIIKKLKIWIFNNVDNLELGSPQTSPKHFIRMKPKELGFEVCLYRFPAINPENNGKLYSTTFSPESLELKRVSRINRSLVDKCPKLAKRKSTCDCITILVLESNDIALANSSVVGDALEKALKKIDPAIIPDKIILIETVSKPWNIFTYQNKCFDFISANQY